MGVPINRGAMLMNVFVYELVTSGGCFLPENRVSPGGSLLQEGQAMRDAVIEDFMAIDGVEVTAMQDVRIPPAERLQQLGVLLHSVDSIASHRQLISQLATDADVALVIAPEIGGHLVRLTSQLHQAGCELLSPDLATLQWASNKIATKQRLVASSISTPPPVNRRHLESTAADVIQKPADGAGCEGIRRWPAARWIREPVSPAGLDQTPYVIEQYCEGRPASVAMIGGLTGPITLTACEQFVTWHESGDGWLQPSYFGGRIITDSNHQERCRRLANQVAQLVGPFRGYIGVDIALADATDGSNDVVIEINPRLTTSYIGLRAATNINLAQTMLYAAAPDPVPWIPFRDVSFHTDGTVVHR